MNTLNVKKGDTVIVLSGKDRGKKGKVLSTHPAAGKVGWKVSTSPQSM